MRRMRLSLLAIIALAVVVLMLAGCGRRGLMKVNGEKVAKDEFYARLERVPVQTVKGGRQVTVPAGQYVIEQMINEKLLLQLAKKEKVEPTKDQIDRKFNYLKRSTGGEFVSQLQQSGVSQEDWRRQMMLQQSIVNLISKGVTVSDAEAKKSYDQQIAKATPGIVRPEAVFISAIITAGPDKINKAYKLLQDGQDFGTVAMQVSEEQNSAKNQGKINWITKNMKGVPSTVIATAFSLDMGKYSKPFQVINGKANSGWMIVRADSKRRANTEKFDDVKELIKEQLASAKAAKDNQKPFDKMLRTFIGESTIQINDERYSKIPEMMKKNAALTSDLQPAKFSGSSSAKK